MAVGLGVDDREVVREEVTERGILHQHLHRCCIGFRGREGQREAKRGRGGDGYAHSGLNSIHFCVEAMREMREEREV